MTVGKRMEAFQCISPKRSNATRNNVNARSGLAYAYMSRNQFADAARQAEAALVVEPNNAKAHYGLGGHDAQNSGRPQEALEHYSKALRVPADHRWRLLSNPARQ